MKRVLIIMPTHNEALVLEKNIKLVFNFASQKLNDYSWTILIADNGSTDATASIAARLSKELPRLSFFHTQENGRGGTLKRAWREAPQEILVYMDADLSTGLEALPAIISALDGRGFDIAVGSRLVPGAKVDRSFFREIISRGYNFLIFLFLRLPVHDAQCGFKAIKKEAAAALVPLVQNNDWFFDTELLFWAHRRGFKITEIPVAWVEARNHARKSRVKIAATVIEYLKEIWRLRSREL